MFRSNVLPPYTGQMLKILRLFLVKRRQPTVYQTGRSPFLKTGARRGCFLRNLAPTCHIPLALYNSLQTER